MRDHILSNPEKITGCLPNEKLQLDSIFPPLFSLLNVMLCGLKQNRAGRWEVIWRIQSTWTIVLLNLDKISLFLLSSRKLWAIIWIHVSASISPLAGLNQWPEARLQPVSLVGQSLAYILCWPWAWCSWQPISSTSFTCPDHAPNHRHIACHGYKLIQAR